MPVETIEPTTWANVWALLAGLASLVVLGGGPVVLYWLRNLLLQQDIHRALLQRQLDELRKNTATTAKVEDIANGRLSAQIQRNQELARENDTLRRLLETIEMDDTGVRALSLARARLDVLKTQQRQGLAEDYSATLDRLLREGTRK